MLNVNYSVLRDYWACPRLSSYRLSPQLRLARPPARAHRGSEIHAALHRAFEGLPTHLSETETELWGAYQQVISPHERTARASWSEWECLVPLSEMVLLTGRLDRVYLQDQAMHLLDWKTGQWQPQYTESTQLQLRFYSWMLWLAREQIVTDGALTKVVASAHFLEDAHIETFTLDSQNAEEEDLFFRELIQNYRRHTETRAGIPAPRSTSEGVWCTLCEYQPLCPEGRYHA